MNVSKLFPLFLAAAWIGVDVAPSQAAWNNVFQACCNKCRSKSTTSYFAPAPACEPKVTYVQRAFYTPYTTYKRETVWEPVTTYKKSFYWEPTTSYSYKSYYDPCTGACQNVATPRTSYRLREKCDPVQSYVQRCQLVPVQSTRTTYYWEPVVSNPCPSCQTSPSPDCPTCGPSTGGAGISETPGAPKPQPGISEGSGNLPPQNLPAGPQTGFRRDVSKPMPTKTPVRMDRSASLSSGAKVEGRIVHFDRFTPRSDVKLVLMNQSREQKPVQADPYGRFQAELPTGEWSIFLVSGTGQSEFHSKIQIQPNQDRNVLVVSRN
jgi:hypothetical protein